MTTAVIEAVERLAKALCYNTIFVLQYKRGIKFYYSAILAGVDQNKTYADQYDNIFRDPDYIQKEKEKSEKEIDNLKNIKSIKMGMKNDL